MIELLESIKGTHWIVLGVTLIIAEIATGTTYILWPALAAILVGILAFFVPLFGWQMQFLLFFLASGILLWLGHKYVRPQMKGGETSDLNDRATAMIGLRVKAVTDFKLGQGRVQVGDTQWRARVVDGNPKAGSELQVKSVKGTTLNVEPYIDLG